MELGLLPRHRVVGHVVVGGPQMTAGQWRRLIARLGLGGPGGERQPTRQVDGHLAGPRGRMVVAGRHALVRELVQSIMLIFSCTAAPLGDMLGIFAIKRSDAHDT